MNAMQIDVIGTTKAALLNAASQVSKDHPTAYVTLHTVFGSAFCTLHKRLDTYTPQDAKFGMYWRNGVGYQFTAKAIAKYNNAGCIKD